MFIIPFICPFFFFSNKIFAKDFSKATSPRILKFGIDIGSLLECVRENQHPHAYHILYLSIYIFLQYNFFVTDFSGPKRVRVFKFCIHLQRIEVYCVKENQDAKISFAFLFTFFPFFPSLTPGKFVSKISQELLQLGFWNLVHWVWLLVLCKRDSAFSCLSFLLFVHFSFSRIKFIVTDFPGTTSPMILKFGTNIGYD